MLFLEWTTSDFAKDAESYSSPDLLRTLRMNRGTVPAARVRMPLALHDGKSYIHSVLKHSDMVSRRRKRRADSVAVHQGDCGCGEVGGRDYEAG